MAHTPGPWLIEDPLGSDAGDSLWIVQEGASGEVYDWRNLAVVCSDDPEDGEGGGDLITVAERDANARLIAAAPELLDALQELLAATEEVGYVHYAPFRAKARAAIAKATVS